MSAINLVQKLSLFADQWSPKIVAALNDYHLKLAKIEGEYIWHSHPETDELFYVVAGSMEMHLRDTVIPMQTGDVYVVPAGVEHKPVAAQECHILLIEPAGTLNTGDASATAQKPSTIGDWI